MARTTGFTATASINLLLNNLFTKAIDAGYGDLYFPVIKKIL